MTFKPIILFVALVSVALAGCTTPEDDHHDHFDPMNFVIVMDEAPMADGMGFTIKFHAFGTEATSTHVGGHHWMASTMDPNGDFSMSAGCTHLAGDQMAPGAFEVRCDTEPGTYFVRGHYRVVEDDMTYNFWTHEYEVTVA